MDFNVTQLERGDLKSLKELYKSAFNRTGDIEMFKWKYFENIQGNASWNGIKENGKLIASGAMITELFSVFGKRVTV